MYSRMRDEVGRMKAILFCVFANDILILSLATGGDDGMSQIVPLS